MRGSKNARQRGGAHRFVRPKRLGRALWLTLLVVLVPASLAGVTGWLYLGAHRPQLVKLIVDPTALIWIVAAISIGWLGWMALIWLTYAKHRPRDLRMASKLAGALSVLLLCAVVTAPMAVGARYAVVQRDLITTVFTSEESSTTPPSSESNPWGHRSRVNLLLLGGDGKVGRPGVRTDSVILASIDVHTGRTILFSLPRNLQRVPFKPGSKLAELYPNGFSGAGSEADYFLNAVYRDVPAFHPGVLGRTDNEGADAAKLAVSGALGISVDYYMLVNLGGFRQIVDAIGGITVNINEPVPIGGNTDAHILPDDYLQPGPNQRLDGFQALWFTRGRYGSTDYKRMERQRCAINAIVAEANPVTLLRRYTRLAHASKQIVRTDIPRRLLSAFVELALKIKDQPLKSVGFERSVAFDPNDPDFAYVQRTVQAALRNPVSRGTGPAAGTPTAVADPSSSPSASPSADPGQVSDATQDCGYHPD